MKRQTEKVGRNADQNDQKGRFSEIDQTHLTNDEAEIVDKHAEDQFRRTDQPNYVDMGDQVNLI